MAVRAHSRRGGGQPRVDRALILRRFAFGESSLVLQVLTPEHGRVHLMAKGAYRPRGRFSWALDYFDTLQLEWTHQRLGELETLRAADIETRRARLSTDLERYRAAHAALELAALDAREGEPSHELFSLVEQTLDLLGDTTLAPRRAQVAFELAFLRQIGLAPALAFCAACGVAVSADADGRALFSASSGGRLCAAHAAEARAAGRRVGTLSAALLEAARVLLEQGCRASLPPDGVASAVRLEELSRFTQRYLEVHLETRLKSHAKSAP